MGEPLISSLANPLVKQARALRDRKARAATRLFLVEGIHHVGEAVQAGWDIEAILYAPDVLTSDFGRDLISHASAQLRAVSTRVMESLADKENPQGILAIVRQKQPRMADLGQIRCGAAVVSPQDPGNVGTILRTLDAVGADCLFVLEGGVDPYHPTAVRASMGALFWKPVIQAGFGEFIAWVHAADYQLVGSSAHATQDYLVFKPSIPWILLLGSEQKGLSPVQIAACDAVVSLPMRGRASSLNLAVAAGILLYELVLDRNR